MNRNSILLTILGALIVGTAIYAVVFNMREASVEGEDESVTAEFAKWLEGIRPPPPPEKPK